MWQLKNSHTNVDLLIMTANEMSTKHGANNTKFVGSIPVWVLYSKYELDDPCGSLQNQNILRNHQADPSWENWDSMKILFYIPKVLSITILFANILPLSWHWCSFQHNYADFVAFSCKCTLSYYCHCYCYFIMQVNITLKL